MSGRRPGDSGAGGPAPVILIVDDDAAKRIALRAILATLGYMIVEADCGRAALRLVMHQTFAIILMDVRMPSLDGYQTASLIRQRSQTRLTPIIFVTAYARDDTEATAAYAMGAVDFVFAPVVPDILRAKVSVLIDLFLRTQESEGSLASIAALNAALLESEVRSRAVLQHVGDGILTLGEAGRIESFNRSAEQMLGYAEHEVVGQPLELILTRGEDLVSAVAWPSEGLLTLPSTSGVQIEVECRRRDGSSFPAEVNVSEMQVGQRRITVACIRDISDRVEAAGRERRHAETLRRDAQRDRAAFDEAPIGSIIASSNGQVERVNQAICAMTGYTPDELIGTHLLELTQPEDGSKTQRIGESVLSGMTPTVRYEKRYVLRDGSVLEAYIALTAIHDDDDQIVQLFAQIVDVTAARRTARELKQAQVEVLDRLAAAAEFRDDDTGQHTRRVGELSVAIARVIELPTTQLELMRLAAPLHDLGKIAVPDAILGKRGKLTEDEFKQMQAHTTIGATLLAGGDNLLLQMAEEIALTHHEKWDGSGYPAGLVGDAIPIAGRIVAVADVFDALTHSRPYKAAWSNTDAIIEMTSQAGRHFDPDVLAAFLDVLRELPADSTADDPDNRKHAVHERRGVLNGHHPDRRADPMPGSIRHT
jgi:putative two-component system response regulator